MQDHRVADGPDAEHRGDDQYGADAESDDDVRALPAPSSDERAGRNVSPAPIVIVAVGILGLGAATAFSALAADRDGAAVREPVQVTAIELQAQRDDLGLIANVLWISAGVVSAVGLVWTVIDVLDAQPRTASARLSLGPAGVVLMARSDRRPVPRAAPS